MVIFYLNAVAQNRSWGPFLSERSAWRYLFGREYTVEEVQAYRDAEWCVTKTPICDDVRSVS